jgi:hypothetical protein
VTVIDINDFKHQIFEVLELRSSKYLQLIFFFGWICLTEIGKKYDEKLYFLVLRVGNIYRLGLGFGFLFLDYVRDACFINKKKFFFLL